MNNEEKITQETKKFMQLVINKYLSMGPETKIEVKVGNERTFSLSGDKKIFVSVLNQAEADRLNETLEKYDLLWNTEIIKDNKDEENELNVGSEENEQEDDLLYPWEELFNNKRRERLEHERKIEEAIEYFSQDQNEKPRVPQKNHKKKRNLKNTFRKIHNKAYKLSEKTKEKAIKAKKYLEKNGKKIGCLIAATALMAGIVYSDVKGYETYDKYGDGEKIEQRMKDVLTNEFKKSLNNPNIYVNTKELIDPDDPPTYVITVTDRNSNLERTLCVGLTELNNPNYMRKIVEKYEEVKKINEKEKGGKISETIRKVKTGKALNKVEKLAGKNDIIIKEGPITGNLNMDRIPERIVDDDNER